MNQDQTTSEQGQVVDACPPARLGVSSASLLRELWDDQLTLTERESELLRAEGDDLEAFLNRYARVRWISLYPAQVSLCSFSLKGGMGDEVVYRYSTLKRLIPRTYLVPWDRERESFDHKQAITGLTKIAGMQDEGVHQVLDIDDINTRCLGGEVVSLEKANGKACVFWVKRFGGRWTLGFGSKTAVDPEHCYDLADPFNARYSWREWVESRLAELRESPPPQVKQRAIIKGVALHTLTRMSQMSEPSIAQLISYLKRGVTLCGELEEGGRHVIPTAHRVVYFAASRLTESGVKLDSPIATAEWLNQLKFQNLAELDSRRSPFTPLKAQPSSLQLSTSRREGSVRYFLDAQGEVIATMKIKDPHYMFYRKLRNAMGSSAQTASEILRRLSRSSRDSYYQRCLREAHIPHDFSAVMLRASARFLWWFTQQPDLGEQFKLAGYDPDQIGLGALMSRWRDSEGEPSLGDYDHVITHPERYELPQAWCQPAQGAGRVAMLALRGAQGSGKTTLSIALCEAFNHAELASSSLHSPQGEKGEKGDNREKTDQSTFARLALPAEQDPLQKRRGYEAWLERAIWPQFRRWLKHHGVKLIGDRLPEALTAPLHWSLVIVGKPSARFPQLLTALCASYQVALERSISELPTASQAHDQAHSQSSVRLKDLLEEAPPLVIVNARCNQNAQATRRWEEWLNDRASAGLVIARLSAPIETLSARVRARGREGDEALLGEVLNRTSAQVSTGVPPDLELDASQPLSHLVAECLPALDLALERVRDQWVF